MNRRNFIIGAAIFPLAAGLPSLPSLGEDPYDRFLRELREQVMQRLDGQDHRLEKLWIDPFKDGQRRVHIVVGGKHISWYQPYG